MLEKPNQTETGEGNGTQESVVTLYTDAGFEGNRYELGMGAVVQSRC